MHDPDDGGEQVDAAFHDRMNVTLSYYGTMLQEHVVDTVTSATFDTSYLVNIPALVGGSSSTSV